MTNTIICAICGGAGHITSDCKIKSKGASSSGGDGNNSANEDSASGNNSPSISGNDRPATWAEREKMDSEYHSLMAELGQGPALDSKTTKSGKSIVSRGGATATSTLAIESSVKSASASIVDAIREEDLKNSKQTPPQSLMGSVVAQPPPPPPPVPAPNAGAAQSQPDPHHAAMMQHYYAQYYNYMWPGYGWGAGAAVPAPPPPPPPPS